MMRMPTAKRPERDPRGSATTDILMIAAASIGLTIFVAAFLLNDGTGFLFDHFQSLISDAVEQVGTDGAAAAATDTATPAAPIGGRSAAALEAPVTAIQ